MKIGLLLVLALLAAGCGKGSGDSSSSSSGGSSASSSAARKIPGGTETRFHGVAFDVPPGWKAQPNGDKLVLAPDGANPAGILEEAYVLAADPSSRTIDGPEADRQLANLIGGGATKKSGPESRKFGDVDGRVWVYTAPGQNGKQAEVRVYAFVGTTTCALLAIGLPESLAKRDHDIEAMLASIAKTPEPKAGEGGVRPELVGEWAWITNFSANNGGGSQSSTSIKLFANGTYRWHYESSSSNPFGGTSGSQNESGTWTATDNSITWRAANGTVSTQRLEKRNHPKNTGDPMIVLDGKCFVTTTNRNPW
ncbi:MAG: lipocalin family protein [Planctomycetes bacterium]|nr:lipocalin family protein [Planctomycetota bacterium]